MIRALVDLVGSHGVFLRGTVVRGVPDHVVSAWIAAGAAESVEEAAIAPAPEVAPSAAPEDGSMAAPETASRRHGGPRRQRRSG